MEITEPSPKHFTIYSKSGCINCNKVKKLLKEKNLLYEIIDCDEYLYEDKDFFLLFIKDKAGINYNTFPIVFDKGVFIGGYNETKEYIDKIFLSFEDLTF